MRSLVLGLVMTLSLIFTACSSKNQDQDEFAASRELQQKIKDNPQSWEGELEFFQSYQRLTDEQKEALTKEVWKYNNEKAQEQKSCFKNRPLRPCGDCDWTIPPPQFDKRTDINASKTMSWDEFKKSFDKYEQEISKKTRSQIRNTEQEIKARSKIQDAK